MAPPPSDEDLYRTVKYRTPWYGKNASARVSVEKHGDGSWGYRWSTSARGMPISPERSEPIYRTAREALDAGADAIDLSLAPASGGTCQIDVLVMWHALRGSEYTLDIDVDKVREAEEVFKESMSDYFLPPEAVAVEPLIIFHC